LIQIFQNLLKLPVYVELGGDDSDTAKLKFTIGAEAFSRSYELRVSQYLCDSSERPPEGCLQYHTGTEGRIQSFNWAGGNGHLQNQLYSICLRQELGFCCVRYQVCAGEIFGIDFAHELAVKGALNEEACAKDFIIIEGSSPTCNLNSVTNRYCGTKLNADVNAEMVLTDASICGKAIH
jgi:hypothetical protein